MNKQIHLLMILAFLIATLFLPQCDCGGSDDETEEFDQAHDNMFEDDDLVDACLDTINWLHDECEMEWEDGFTFIEARCKTAIDTAWISCIIDVPANALNCIDAISQAEDCEILFN